MPTVILQFIFLLLVLDIRHVFGQNCTTLDNPAHGRVVLLTRGRVGKFRCYRYYKLFGKKITICSDGKWSHPPPICIRKGCYDIQSTGNLTVFKDIDGAVAEFKCVHPLKLTGEKLITCDGMTWSAPVPSCEHAEPEYYCDFEDESMCDWKHDKQANIEWKRNYGTTPTRRTGPKYDHTLGKDENGHYMFMESSSPIKMNDTARLQSRYYPATTGGLCFEIWYHMWGVVGYNQVGRLNIYIEELGQSDTLSQKAEFHVSGNQGDEWIKGRFPVGERKMSFRFIIEGTRLKSFLSDISVDDPKLYNCSDDYTESTLLYRDTTPIDTTESGVQTTTMYHRPFETTEASSSLATTITRLVKTTEELTAFPTGHYMFMESSYPIKLIDKERLLSPYFPATTGGLCFAIWYHMFGVVGYNQVGRLKIYIEKIGQKDTIPQKAELDVFGNQGEGWIKGQFPVGERKTYFRFIIEGTKLKDYLGDIFVNNPKLYNCSDEPTTDSVRWNLTSATERHDVSCLSDSISVFIPSDLLSHYQTTWRDPHCQVQDNGTHYVSTISHTSCGTTVIFTKDEVIFENELILHKSGSPSNQTSKDSIDFGSSSSEVIPVQCIYPRRQNITTLYRPAQSKVRFYEKRYGHMDVQLEQYRSGMFVTPLPVRSFPNEVEINKDMYFILHAMHVNSTDVAVKVDSCVATPTNMPADGRIYQLLDQGCPASPAVKVYPSSFDEVRFSVRAFEFRTSPGGIVYIHCQVSVCSPTSPQCRVGCAHRHRREVSTEDGGSHLVSGGPYLLVADKGGLQVSTVVAGVCASVAVVATVIAIIGWRRKSSASTSSSKL